MRPTPQRWLYAVLIPALVALSRVVLADDDVPPASTLPPWMESAQPRPDHVPSEEFQFILPGEPGPVANDVRVSTPATALAEVSIDVNPTNALNLVVFGHSSTGGWMDSYYTVDGGATWNYVRVGSEQDGFPFEYRFDPALTFDADGNVYVAYGVITGVYPTRIAHVIVCKSTDGGKTYTQSAEVFGANRVLNVPGNDKFMIATGLDPVVAGRQNVYVAWTWNVPQGLNVDQQIAVSASTDGGATFSFPVVINDNSLPGRDRALFADPSVGPDGELYVSWHDFDNSARIMVDRSFDGGVTWGTDVVVSNFAIGLRTPIPPQPDRGIAAGPVMDVDTSNGPYRGRAYVAYSNAGAFGIDVSVRYSDDQAATWSEPVRVCDDPTLRSQFLPWIDVGPGNGIVSVVFYDAREDPSDQLVKVYSALSRTGGESFEPNRPVADIPSNMSVTNDNRYLGNYLEYIGVATLDCAAYVVWTDTRHNWPVWTGWGDYYFDRIPFETTPPQIVCPAPLELECVRGGIPLTDPRVVAWAATCLASDECAPESAVKFTVISNTNPPVLGQGTNIARFTAYDTAGNFATCDANVTVVDHVPPVFNVTINPDVLWPPDHRWVDVATSVTSSDGCRQVNWTLWSVTSNEPENDGGDGDTAPDIQGAAPGLADRFFQLRAERSGTGTDRKYQVVYRGTDQTFVVYDTVQVTVPHDRDAEPHVFDNVTASALVTRLNDVHPNPFNPQTTVSFELARTHRVHIEIADVRGAHVRTLLDEVRTAGAHRERWHGRDDAGRSVASGVYFVRMHAGAYTAVRKMVLLK